MQRDELKLKFLSILKYGGLRHFFSSIMVNLCGAFANRCSRLFCIDITRHDANGSQYGDRLHGSARRFTNDRR